MNIDLWQLKLHWPFLSQSFTICMCMYIILKHWISETTILLITLQKFIFFHSSHVLVLVCRFSFSQFLNLTRSPFLEAKLITQLFSWILYNSPSTVERKSTASPPSGFPPASLICLRSSSEDVESDKNKRFLRIHIMLYLEIVHSSKIFHNFTFGNSSFVSLSWFKWFLHKFQLFIGFWKGM